MTKKIVPPQSPQKDANGSYLPSPPLASSGLEAEPPKDAYANLSIDDLMQKGLLALERLMKYVLREISTGAPSRNSVMALKDAMAMLHDLKVHEDSLLKDASEETLEKIAKGEK